MKQNTIIVESMLRQAKLRPTRQRIALAELLFSKGDRHLAAEDLFEEARHSGVEVSLATIYNTLHQFTENGLLRAISIDSNKTYFDTNTSNHHHFYLEGENEVVDMPQGYVSVDNLPEPPEGMEISRVDVVVRVRKQGKHRHL
ncbi:MAG: iron response transcriptional regulator IrrA [Pseudomonadota bacterium]